MDCFESRIKFLIEARKKYGNRFIYLNLEKYKNNYSKLFINCRWCDNIFEKIAEVHIKEGIQCGKCKKKKITKDKYQFTYESRLIHGNKYGYDRVKYVDSSTKVKIYCRKCEKYFPQYPYAHIDRANNCQTCTASSRVSYESFLERAIKVHGNRYDYSLSKASYTMMKNKVKIICKKHGEFLQYARDHVRGVGCGKCTRPILNNTDFINAARNVHGNKYDYSLVKYEKTKSKVIIICPTHGKFEQSAGNHLNGSNCQECSKETITEKNTLTQDKVINRFKEKHGNKYNYDKVVYSHNAELVIITCPTHGDFKQRPYDHWSGRGCNKCQVNNYSKIAIKWLEIISQYLNLYIQHAENEGEEIISVNNHKYHVDGFSAPIIFDFYGCYWHGCRVCYDGDCINKLNKKSMKELYEKTIEREKSLSEDYIFVSIWEHEFEELIKYGTNPKTNSKLKKYLNNL